MYHYLDPYLPLWRYDLQNLCTFMSNKWSESYVLDGLKTLTLPKESLLQSCYISLTLPYYDVTPGCFFPLFCSNWNYVNGRIWNTVYHSRSANPRYVHLHIACDSPLSVAVLRIRDILLRIRIGGSVPLTNGFGSGSTPDPAFFVNGLQEGDKKIIY